MRLICPLVKGDGVGISAGLFHLSLPYELEACNELLYLHPETVLGCGDTVEVGGDDLHSILAREGHLVPSALIKGELCEVVFWERTVGLPYVLEFLDGGRLKRHIGHAEELELPIDYWEYPGFHATEARSTVLAIAVEFALYAIDVDF